MNYVPTANCIYYFHINTFCHRNRIKKTSIFIECHFCNEDFKILKLNSPQQTYTLTYNGGGSGDKVRTLSFKFSTTELSRKEVESKICSYVLRGKL